MLASDYGEILNKGILSEDNITRFTIKNKHNQIIIMDTHDNKNICEQIGSSNIKWVDTQLENNIIKREVLGKGSKIFYFQDNKTILSEKEVNAKLFRSVATDKKLDSGSVFMTIYIKTVTINKTHVPYLICGYTNNKYIYSYAEDLTEEGITKMFQDFIKQMLEI